MERKLGAIRRKWVDAGFIDRPFDYARRKFRDLAAETRLMLRVAVTDPNSRESVPKDYRLTFQKFTDDPEDPFGVRLKVRADEPLRYQLRDGKWQDRSNEAASTAA